MASLPIAGPSAPRTPQSKHAASVAAPSKHFVESSPAKPANRLITARKDIADSKFALDKTTDSRFSKNHLAKLPDNLEWKHKHDSRQIELIEGAGSTEKSMYGPLCTLLSNYSKRIHKSLDKRSAPGAPYVFLDHHHYSPTHHPYRPDDKPDLLAVPGPLKKYKQVTIDGRDDYREVPHYKVVSLVECKADGEEGRVQAASYSFQLLEARPDMPGVYLAWARPDGYQILWSDASGVVASKMTPWSNLKLLATYVYSLYCPPSSHPLRDPSIVASKKKLKPEDPLLWTIKVPGRPAYGGCQTIFVGNSWGRRTNVFKHRDKHSNIVVIKDSYRDDKRRHKEEVLLKSVHEKRIYPGVVRPLFDMPHDGKPIKTASPFITSSTRCTERVKARFVMGSYGESLRQAQSVLDILKTFYDALEVHRGLVRDAKVLHRDISRYNILMYPEHNPETMSDTPLMPDPPLFIEQVLSRNKEWDGTDKSKGLLIDFDNGAEYDFNKGDSQSTKELAARTGTPMYIARSVARGAALGLDDTLQWPQMPLLSPSALDYYIHAYSIEEYEARNDASDACHGRKPPKVEEGKSPKKPVFFHRPDHDVESFYWVLVATLLKARPETDLKDHKNLTGYWDVYGGFLQHSIDEGKKNDSRSFILRCDQEQLEDALHPKLKGLVSMLRKMARQIVPEYGYLEPEPAFDHLHEAMRRLLLEQIVKMQMENDPIKLEAGSSRPLRDEVVIQTSQHPQPQVRMSTRASTKRKSEHQSQEVVIVKRARGGI